MLDQVAVQDFVVEQLLRALASCPPAVYGPPTAACANWTLGISPAGTHALLPNTFSLGTGGAAIPNTLGARIRLVAQSAANVATCDANSLTDIVNAVDDAARFADRFIAGTKPRISLTTEGTVLLTWDTADEGTALLFVGDGTVVYSKSGNGFSYSESGVEYSVREPLPEDYRERIYSNS